MAEEGTQYQWIKGDNQGTIETFKDQSGEFLQFESGRRCNQSLIGEFMIEINIDNPALNFEEPDMAQFVKKPVVSKVKETVVSKVKTKSKKADNPLIPLIEKSKKRKTKLNVRLDIELPSKTFLGVMEDSFDDDVIQVLSDHLIDGMDPENFLRKAVKQSILEWYKYNNKNKKDAS